MLSTFSEYKSKTKNSNNIESGGGDLLPKEGLTVSTCRNSRLVFVRMAYTDSSIAFGDDSLQIPGYNLVQCDHSSNTKRRGVCVYYISHLP